MRIPAGVRRVFRFPSSRERIARDLDDEVRFHVEMRAQATRAGLSRRAGVRRGTAPIRRRRRPARLLRLHRGGPHASHPRARTTRDHRAGPSLRAPAVSQESRLRASRDAHARTRRRRDDGDLQRRERRRPAAAAVPAVGADGALCGLDSKGHRCATFADPTFDVLAERNRSFSALAKYGQRAMTVVDEGEAERIEARCRLEAVLRRART